MTSAHLIRARLAAYEHHRCTTLSCSEVWIHCWILSGVCIQRQACRGWLYKPPLFRYTVQCAKNSRCDDTGDFTAWPVTAPWQPGRGKLKHCDRGRSSQRASPTERKSMTSSAGFPSSSTPTTRPGWGWGGTCPPPPGQWR